ncbi:MAG: polysaccharide deacetylase family protein [Robiginitomaculum sp.]|nr:polysaccharide deacetylase family protein [Robiginitomaculum sp.]
MKYFWLFIIRFSFFIIYYSVAFASSTEVTPATNNAVILMYHNIAVNTPPGTSVRPERFQQHMAYLADNGFTIWPLFKTLLYLANGKPVPDKTVVLTFDDAYSSVYNEAFPVLKARGWPFTVFVTGQYMGAGYTHYVNWQQLREMQGFGAEIGNHSFTHRHLIRHRSDETKAQWRKRIIDEVERAQFILQQNVNNPIIVLAYPYGEYSKELTVLLHGLGYFAVGQQSGAVSSASDFQALPRFPMATGFDGMEDFAIKVSTKDLPVTVLSPEDGIVSKDTDIPVLIMRLENGDYKKAGLRCYASGQGQINVDWLDRENSVVVVRAKQKINPGRTKLSLRSIIDAPFSS